MILMFLLMAALLVLFYMVNQDEPSTESKILFVFLLILIIIELVLTGGQDRPLGEPESHKVEESKMINYLVESLEPHKSDSEIITGIVVELGDPIVVESVLALPQSMTNSLFYTYKNVEYRVKTDDTLNIGDEVILSKTITGSFIYLGKVKK